MPDDNPNPNPAATPGAEQGAAPAGTPQVKPWWEAKGFNSEAEALSAWDERDRTLTDAQTRAAAAERALQVVTSVPAPEGGNATPATPGYRRYFAGQNLSEAYADPERYAEVLLEGAAKMFEEQQTKFAARQEAARKQREAFFKTNKDLEKFPDLVMRHTQQVMNENPQITYAEGAKEVARRARAEIAAIKSDGTPEANPGGQPKPKDALPHVGAGGAAGGAPPNPAPKTEPAPQDDVASEIDRRIALRAGKTSLR